MTVDITWIVRLPSCPGRRPTQQTAIHFLLCNVFRSFFQPSTSTKTKNWNSVFMKSNHAHKCNSTSFRSRQAVSYHSSFVPVRNKSLDVKHVKNSQWGKRKKLAPTPVTSLYKTTNCFLGHKEDDVRAGHTIVPQTVYF